MIEKRGGEPLPTWPWTTAALCERSFPPLASASSPFSSAPSSQASLVALLRDVSYATAPPTISTMDVRLAAPFLVPLVVAAATAWYWRRRGRHSGKAAPEQQLSAAAEAWAPLARAATEGDGDLLRARLGAGVPIDSEHRAQLVGLAMENKHFALAESLAALHTSDDPAWVNAPLGDACLTVLHIAASAGHAGMVSCLLEAGATVDQQDGSGQTPLFMAASGGHCDAVTELLEAGGSPVERSRTMKTPLHYAAHNNHVSVIELLLSSVDNGEEIKEMLTAGDVSGYVPLHAACIGAAPEAVECLLRRGCDASVAARDGSTPIHVAVRKAEGHAPTILAILLRHGATLNGLDAFGAGIVHAACSKCDPDSLAALLAAAKERGVLIEAATQCDDGEAHFPCA